MVTAYRRHQARCKYANKKKYPEPRKHKDCTCPVHMDGGSEREGPGGGEFGVVPVSRIAVKPWGASVVVSLVVWRAAMRFPSPFEYSAPQSPVPSGFGFDPFRRWPPIFGLSSFVAVLQRRQRLRTVPKG